MPLASLGPNWALMRHPLNWAFVAFVFVLVVLSVTTARDGLSKGK